MAMWPLSRRKLMRAWEALSDRAAWQTSRRHTAPNYIINRWQGGKPLAGAKKIAVLAHFSAQKYFADYFVYLLRSLEQAGFTTIVVSNSRKLDLESVREILPLCGRILQRRNIGYDFGAWRDGITDTPEIGDADQLLIMNDSVFGPLQDLSAIFDRCQFDRTDVWGMTDSYDRKYHLQSFFVLFGKRAIGSEAFSKFWQKMRYIGNKRVVIVKHEIGLSQTLLKAGLKLKALYPYRRLSEAVFNCAMAFQADAEHGVHPLHRRYFEHLLDGVNAGRPLNPTHYFWKYLIVEMGFPFIKRELLEKNPVGIPLLVHWRSTIREVSDYPVDMIEDYIQTAARNKIF